MAWAQANLQQVRQETIKRLYVEEDLIIGTASAGTSTTQIVDVGADDRGAHLESGMLSNRTFIGIWVWIVTRNWSRITSYDPASGTVTLSPAVTGLTTGDTYEMHYKVHPLRINQFIKDRARVGSKQAMETIAEATAINMDYNVLTEGVLADCKRVMAKRETGDERRRLIDEATEHEVLWQEGLIMHGYGTSWLGPQLEQEATEENNVLRPSVMIPRRS